MTITDLHVYKNGIRYHRTPIGDLPGVTSVLKETKDKYAKRAIASWIRKVGLEVSEGVLRNSTGRGDGLHATIEAFLLDSKPKAVNQQTIALWKLVRPFVESVKAQEGEKYIERHTHHELGFAGTPDLVCQIDGEWTVIDWKNSRKPKKRSYIRDYLQQVAAYAKSHEYTYGNKIIKGIIVCAVHGDQYLPITDPGVEVESELQMFKLTTKSLETHWNNFTNRVNEFHHLQDNPNWFDTSIDEENLIW